MDFYFIYLHCADTSSLLPMSLLSSVRQCFHHTADGFAWGVWQGGVSVLPLSRQDVLASSFLPPCPISCPFSQGRKHCTIWTWSVNKIVILGPWRLGRRLLREVVPTTHPSFPSETQFCRLVQYSMSSQDCTWFYSWCSHNLQVAIGDCLGLQLKQPYLFIVALSRHFLNLLWLFPKVFGGAGVLSSSSLGILLPWNWGWLLSPNAHFSEWQAGGMTAVWSPWCPQRM